MKYKLLGIFLLSAVIFSACTGNGESLGDLSLTDSGKIAPMEELKYDWKDINIEGGNVSKSFKLKNDGDDDLVIKSALTTCMCTTAQVELANGQKSPEFGMHDKINWGGIVNPGEEFTLNIVFDPMAHGPDAVGPITRGIYLMTSSVENGNYAKKSHQTGNEMVTEIMVSGNVLSKADFEKKQSAEKPAIDLSGFLFTEVEKDFGVVKQSGDIVAYEFPFTYNGENPIKVTGVPTSCSCTTAKIDKSELKKGDTGVITVEFDPNLHEEPEGKFFKTISLLTDPALEKQPELKIWAEIDLDLGPEAYKLKNHKD